jgi:hypothetical protein
MKKGVKVAAIARLRVKPRSHDSRTAFLWSFVGRTKTASCALLISTRISSNVLLRAGLHRSLQCKKILH